MIRFFKKLWRELFNHAWRDWFGESIMVINGSRRGRVGEAFGGDGYVVSRAGRFDPNTRKQRVRLRKVPSRPSLETYLALDEYSELTEEAFDRFLREGIYGK